MQKPTSSHPPEPDKYLGFQEQHSEKWRKMNSYSASEAIKKDHTDTTTSVHTLNNNRTSINQLLPKSNENQFATVESHQETKRMTLNDKFSICSPFTQNMTLLQTLEADLTSRGRVLKPFWNALSVETSKKLWLPTKTDSADLALNSFNTSSQSIVEDKSWFSTILHTPQKPSLPTTFFKYLQSSQPASTDSESTNVRSKRIRLFPDKNQKDTLKEWFGITRWFYNRTIDYIETRRQNNESFQTFQTVRNNLRNKETRKFDIPEWINHKLPSKVIVGAIEDCCNAYKSSFAKYKSSKNPFTIHYRTKKSGLQSLNLELGCFGKNNAILPTFLGKNLKVQFKKNHKTVNLCDMEAINHGCRLVSEDNGRLYFLMIPTDVKVDEKQVNSNVISLDSGIRTFLTGYSPSHHVIEIGSNTGEHLLKYLDRQDMLHSVMSAQNNKRKLTRYRRRYGMISRRLTHLTDDLHWKSIKYLTNHYGLVVLSDFRVSELIKLKKLNRKSKRIMTLQSHYKFRVRLEQKCKQKGVQLYVVDESYTSKTCTNCGSLHSNLGGSKEYRCVNCGISLDRDVNGARNIFIKNFESYQGCLEI
jgi:putative transposase